MAPRPSAQLCPTGQLPSDSKRSLAVSRPALAALKVSGSGASPPGPGACASSFAMSARLYWSSDSGFLVMGETYLSRTQAHKRRSSSREVPAIRPGALIASRPNAAPRPMCNPFQSVNCRVSAAVAVSSILRSLAGLLGRLVTADPDVSACSYPVNGIHANYKGEATK